MQQDFNWNNEFQNVVYKKHGPACAKENIHLLLRNSAYQIISFIRQFNG